VVSAYAADEFNKVTFNVQNIKGDYFMILENRPIFQSIIPLEDILTTINLSK